MAATIYGIALNDADQRQAMGEALRAPPYAAPPQSPVLYIKPSTCVTHSGGTVPIPAALQDVEAAATIALSFSGAPNVPTGAALAIDLCEPHDSYYRPAVRQRCRDGFLPLGAFDGNLERLGDTTIALSVDGLSVHSWRLDRLVRGLPALVRDISSFMTLSDDDILLIGLPADAPRVSVGSQLRVSADGFSPLSVRLVTEAAR